MRPVASDHQQWRIRVRAKSKLFNFNLNATNLLPNWKFLRLSIFLELKRPRFLLHLNLKSLSRSSIRSHRSSSFKSKFLGILRKCRGSRTGKDRSVAIASTRCSRIERFVNHLKQSIGVSDDYGKRLIWIGSVVARIARFMIRFVNLKVFLGGLVICLVVFGLFGNCFVSEHICRWIRELN